MSWFEARPGAEEPWREHVIESDIEAVRHFVGASDIDNDGDADVVSAEMHQGEGPMSLSVADMDGDGDLDVVVGEHNLEHPEHARLLVFENMDGKGARWKMELIHVGDEHHDGAHVTDLDQDGDMDIVSMGWGHDQVIIYENRKGACPRSTSGPTEVRPHES